MSDDRCSPIAVGGGLKQAAGVNVVLARNTALARHLGVAAQVPRPQPRPQPLPV